jgi:hypothetical protein
VAADLLPGEAHDREAGQHQRREHPARAPPRVAVEQDRGPRPGRREQRGALDDARYREGR